MLTDYLVTQLPGVFAAAAPWYGAFLEHYLTPPARAALSSTSLFSLHGAKDKLIPASGGEDSLWHYQYVSEQRAVGAWAAANGCEAAASAAMTPWSRIDTMQCVEHRGCRRGVLVLYCSFTEEKHGFWPDYAEELTWWFFERVGNGEGALPTA